MFLIEAVPVKGCVCSRRFAPGTRGEATGDSLGTEATAGGRDHLWVLLPLQQGPLCPILHPHCSQSCFLVEFPGTSATCVRF